MSSIKDSGKWVVWPRFLAWFNFLKTCGLIKRDRLWPSSPTACFSIPFDYFGQICCGFMTKSPRSSMLLSNILNSRIHIREFYSTLDSRERHRCNTCTVSLSFIFSSGFECAETRAWAYILWSRGWILPYLSKYLIFFTLACPFIKGFKSPVPALCFGIGWKDLKRSPPPLPFSMSLWKLKYSKCYAMLAGVCRCRRGVERSLFRTSICLRW